MYSLKLYDKLDVAQLSCGCILDLEEIRFAARDVTAARVMINYALGSGTGLINRGVEASTFSYTFCGGFKQASTMK